MFEFNKFTEIDIKTFLFNINETNKKYKNIIYEFKNRLILLLLTLIINLKIIYLHEFNIILILLKPIYKTLNECNLINFQIVLNDLTEITKLSDTIGINFFFITIYPIILLQYWYFLKPALYNNEKKKLKKQLFFLFCYFYLHILIFYYIILPTYTETFIFEMDSLLNETPQTKLLSNKIFLLNLNMLKYISLILTLWYKYIIIMIIPLGIIYIFQKIKIKNINKINKIFIYFIVFSIYILVTQEINFDYNIYFLIEIFNIELILLYFIFKTNYQTQFKNLN